MALTGPNREFGFSGTVSGTDVAIAFQKSGIQFSSDTFVAKAGALLTTSGISTSFNSAAMTKLELNLDELQTQALELNESLRKAKKRTRNEEANVIREINSSRESARTFLKQIPG